MENALTAFVDHLKCAVCLELPSDPSSLPCNHCFCKKCILLALDHKPQCPICKQTTTRRKAKTNEMVAEIVKNVILFKSAQEDMDNSTENGTENGTENSTEDGTEYDSSQTKQKLGKRVPLQMVKQGNNELMQRNEWMPKRAAMDCSLTGMFHIVTTQVPSTELKTVKICTDRMKSTLHNAWNVDTTHVVLPARSELGKYYAVKRSFKVLQGLVHGKWIVSMDWVFACSKAGGYVPEDKYEISAIYKCRNLHGAMGSPKRSRELAFMPSGRLFGSMIFLVLGAELVRGRPSLKEVESLIDAGAGTACTKVGFRNRIQQAIENEKYIILLGDASALQDKTLLRYQTVAMKQKVSIVHLNWLLDSISVYRLLAFSEYKNCNEQYT